MTKTCQAWERGQAGPGSLGLGRGPGYQTLSGLQRQRKHKGGLWEEACGLRKNELGARGRSYWKTHGVT